jgi:ubiquinone/menaquinone biosynthesis C-methylase UbiE
MKPTTPFIPAIKYPFLTPYYDKIIRWVVPERQIRMYISQLMSGGSRKKILDVGVGTGTQLAYIHRRNPSFSLYGWDVDPEIIPIAKQKIGQFTELTCTLPPDIPYPDQHFDSVLCTWVIHHLTDTQKLHLLREIHRVLKPKGELLLGDWGKPKTIWLRMAFWLVQLLDNFETMRAHKNGEIPTFITQSGFINREEKAHFPTLMGSFYIIMANKST